MYKQTRLKRILGAVLSTAMLFASLPATALAAEVLVEPEEEVVTEDASYSGYETITSSGSMINMGTDVLERGSRVVMGEDKGKKYTWVDEPPIWIVLDPDKANSGQDGVFVLSQELIRGPGDPGYIKFNLKEKDGNQWQGSNAQAFCLDLFDDVLSEEAGAILKTSKSDDEYTTKGSVTNKFAASPHILNGDQIFFLSAEEAENADYGFWENEKRRALSEPYYTGSYWLRSPDFDDTKYAGYVNNTGEIRYTEVHMYSTTSTRPAFNIIPKAVLFTSLVGYGKLSDGTGADSMKKVTYGGEAYWKFTLLDDGSTDSAGSGHKDFSAAKKSFDGTKLVFSFDGAVKGTGEMISAIITNSEKNVIKYYGNIMETDSVTNAIAEINLKGKLEDGDRLFVFNEKLNGDYKTDFASALKELSLDITVDGVTLDQSAAELKVGAKLSLKATITPDNAANKNMTWKSDNTAVAEVDATGVVTAKAAGTAKITVTTQDGGKTAECTVVVRVPVTGVTLNQTNAEPEVGKTVTLTATVAPDNATDKTVTWKSDNESVATINNGVVKAKAAGTAKITVTTADGGFGAECVVTVKAPGSGDAGDGKMEEEGLPDVDGKDAKADDLTGEVEGAKEAKPGSWKGNAKSGKWYDTGKGTYAKDGIYIIENSYYYFDKSGYMKTGWQKIGGKYYFFNKNGKMQIGWLKSGKKWYYLNPRTGVMMTGWVKVGGKWYLLNKSGAMQTGWQKSGKKWYYMNKNGVMQTGWKKISGKWYYLEKKSGAMKTGWLNDGGKWYYLDKKSGAMKTGWVKSGGKWYYMDSKGRMLVNTSRKIGKKTYSFNKSGVCMDS